MSVKSWSKPLTHSNRGLMSHWVRKWLLGHVLRMREGQETLTGSMTTGVLWEFQGTKTELELSLTPPSDAALSLHVGTRRTKAPALPRA